MSSDGRSFEESCNRMTRGGSIAVAGWYVGLTTHDSSSSNARKGTDRTERRTNSLYRHAQHMGDGGLEGV